MVQLECDMGEGAESALSGRNPLGLVSIFRMDEDSRRDRAENGRRDADGEGARDGRNREERGADGEDAPPTEVVPCRPADEEKKRGGGGHTPQSTSNITLGDALARPNPL